VKKQILKIRKQSRIEIPKENLWFFSEDSGETHTSTTVKKSLRRDKLSILNDDFNRQTLPRNPEEKRDRLECTFVVDWQMLEIF